MKREFENNSALHQEWIALHQSYEKSESLTLLIKLTGILVCVIGSICSVSVTVTSLLLLVLWLQEAIWKTFQGRTEQRLLTVEKNLRLNDEVSGFQFYSEWSSLRPSMTGLISEYLKNTLRPTIVYPYIVLLVIMICVTLQR